MTSAASRLVCAGCEREVSAERPIIWACPNAAAGDDIDHVLKRVLDPGADVRADGEVADEPFVRYRRRFHSYQVAIANGWSDGRYVATVRELDEAIAAVDGAGFRTTPLVRRFR